jgi:hypothetical protein
MNGPPNMTKLNKKSTNDTGTTSARRAAIKMN